MKIKAILAASLAIMTLFSMTACGNKSDKPDKKDTDTTSVTTEVTTEETESETKSDKKNTEKETEVETESKNDSEEEVISEATEPTSKEESIDSESHLYIDPAADPVETAPEVKILSHKVSEDWEGKPCLVIEYEWTNNNKVDSNFLWSCMESVTQNGNDLTTMVVGCEDLDSAISDNIRMQELAAGETAVIKLGYMLENNTDDVKVKIENFNRDVKVLEETLELK